jgi:uncharacterized protein (DUF58 family)
MLKPTETFKQIHRLQIIARRHVDSFFSGIYRSAFKGNGLEFEDIREYQAGDDIRLMNWNVTARTGHPFIKTFREERELSLMLIVDISASSRFSHTGRLKSELIAELAAILAFSAIRNQDKVGLLLFSSEVELYLKPKKGTKHVLRLIRELLYFTPQYLGTNLQKALIFLGRLQKHRTLCFLISDFLADQFSSQIPLIAKKHELIAVHIYDSYEKIFHPKAFFTLKDLETQEEVVVDTENPAVQDHFQNQSQKKNFGHANTFSKRWR